MDIRSELYSLATWTFNGYKAKVGKNGMDWEEALQRCARRRSIYLYPGEIPLVIEIIQRTENRWKLKNAQFLGGIKSGVDRKSINGRVVKSGKPNS